MQIKIAERLKPFTHTPGRMCPIPGSCNVLQVFPEKVRIFDFSQIDMKLMVELQLPIIGPVEQFTVQCDLEGGDISVWGKSPEGFFRYYIHSISESALPAMVIDQFPSGAVDAITGSIFSMSETTYLFEPNIRSCTKSLPASDERISLGIDKKQDWSQVNRRADMREIFPFWFRLGQLIPYERADIPHEGTFSLLHHCINGERSFDSFRKCYLAGFQGLLVPRGIDTDYQGFQLQPLVSKDLSSPLALLTQGSHLIRSLLLKENEKQIEILPQVPRQINHGRFINFDVGSKLSMDLIWAKRKPKMMVIRPKVDCAYQLVFPKNIKHFRIRNREDEKGKTISSTESLPFQSKNVYLLDKFHI